MSTNWDIDKYKKVEKHFKDVLDQTIQPGKYSPTQQPKTDVQSGTDTYWTTNAVQWNNSYQTGKLLAKAKEFKKSTEILSLLADLIVLGIKRGTLKGGSTEKLRNHFDTLISLLKAIESDLNAHFERINTENIDTPKEFDNKELLALLNGLLTVKVYGQTDRP